MRKATVVFGLITALFVLAPQIFAEVIVEKPELPQGYESWPYQLKHNCDNLNENVYGRVDKDKRMVEYIVVSSMGGRVFAFEENSGSLEKPYVMNWYFQTNNQWLKFNALNAKEKRTFTDNFFKTLNQLGMSDQFYAKNCQKFDDEKYDFFDQLREELNKK